MATLHVRNVPDGLYEALRERAAAEGRSIGAQVVTILEESVVQLGPRRMERLRRLRRRGGPFARFTRDARRVVVRAQVEARELGHDYVGTEHLLLGLFGVENGIAARALQELGLSVAAARSGVLEIVGRGERAPSGRLPFTPRAKHVLELALREALGLGDGYIGDVHVLLALAAEEGIAAQLLCARGIHRARLLDALRPLRDEPAPADLRLGLDELRVVALEGSADDWTARLAADAAEGWELVQVVTAPDPRAVLRRPGA